MSAMRKAGTTGATLQMNERAARYSGRAAPLRCPRGHRARPHRPRTRRAVRSCHARPTSGPPLGEEKRMKNGRDRGDEQREGRRRGAELPHSAADGLVHQRPSRRRAQPTFAVRSVEGLQDRWILSVAAAQACSSPRRWSVAAQRLRRGGDLPTASLVVGVLATPHDCSLFAASRRPERRPGASARLRPASPVRPTAAEP